MNSTFKYEVPHPVAKNGRSEFDGSTPGILAPDISASLQKMSELSKTSGIPLMTMGDFTHHGGGSRPPTRGRAALDRAYQAIKDKKSLENGSSRHTMESAKIKSDKREQVTFDVPPVVETTPKVVVPSDASACVPLSPAESIPTNTTPLTLARPLHRTSVESWGTYASLSTPTIRLKWHYILFILVVFGLQYYFFNHTAGHVVESWAKLIDFITARHNNFRPRHVINLTLYSCLSTILYCAAQRQCYKLLRHTFFHCRTALYPSAFNPPSLNGSTTRIVATEVWKSQSSFDLGDYPFVEEGVIYADIAEKLLTNNVGTHIDSCITRKFHRLALGYFHESECSGVMDNHVLLNTVMYSVCMIRVSNARLALSLPDHPYNGKVKVSWS